MNQKEATKIGLELLKDSPLSEESKGLAESYLPYIVQRYYLAGYEVTEKQQFKLGQSVTKEELGQMLESGVIY
jgi:hypothetical protein